MANYKNYTNKEMQAVTIAKTIEDGQIVIVGTGLPLIGASLAKRCFAPNCNLIVTNEWLHDENRMIAFIGGAQIDPYGNVNSTCIGDYHNPKTRFTGSGGANGIATFVNAVIMMQHEKRRFIDKIDYVTSPGWIDGPDGRAKLGLPSNRGPIAVVTDRGVLKFDEETKRMYLAGYYPTSSPEDVIENTGFDIDVSRAVLLDAPDEDVIRMIREDIDPGQAFIKVPVEE